MTRTIYVTGARGGHGASTVAAALALLSAREHPTELVAHDRADMAALLGIPAPGEDENPIAVAPQLDLRGGEAAAGVTLVVVDAGSRLEGSQSHGECEHYVVVRGPCYLALRSLVRAAPGSYDGVILLTEPARSLRATDVAEVLGVPVVAEVAQHPAVARCIDAGLLPARIHRLRPLAPLSTLALDPPRRSTSRHATTTATTHPTCPRPDLPLPERTTDESSTDLPCPLFSGHGGRRPGSRARIGGGRGRALRSREGPSNAQHREVAAGCC